MELYHAPYHLCTQWKQRERIVFQIAFVKIVEYVCLGETDLCGFSTNGRNVKQGEPIQQHWNITRW